MRSISPETGSRKTLYLNLAIVVILSLALLFGCWATGILPVSQVKSEEISTSTSTVLQISEVLPSSTPESILPESATGLSATDSPIVLIGTIIDGTGAEPVRDTVMIIQEEKITAIGSLGEVEIPADAHIFNLEGMTILPGFINAHVHNAYDPVLLSRWAQEGVTMVRDLGARHPFTRFPERDRNNQNPEFATVVSSGPLVTVPGGYPIAYNHFASLAVTCPDHARREITELIEEGADVIKIVIQEDADIPTLSMERALAIVEAAHQFNIPVSAHITSLNDLKFALEVGVDDLAHIVAYDRVPGYLLERMVDENIFWVPTLEPYNGRDGDNLKRFVALGGKVALGNDGGMLPGVQIGMPIQEIEMMYDEGLSPMEIIVASTANAAAVCHLDGTHGTLEEGKIADILVVYGNPLEDLYALTDVRMVIHYGVIIRDTP